MVLRAFMSVLMMLTMLDVFVAPMLQLTGYRFEFWFEPPSFQTSSERVEVFFQDRLGLWF